MTVAPGSSRFVMVDPAMVAEVGPAAAVLHGHIAWRAERDGSWRATRRQMQAETGLTDSMLRTAISVLREGGLVASERTSPDDATLIWKPAFMASDLDMVNSAPPPVESAIPPLRNPPSPPMRQVEDKTIPSSSADAEGLFTEEQPAARPLRSVPSEVELDAEFAKFWSLYPRRVGKKDARKAYGAARRDTSVVQIATGLRRQLPALQSLEPRYVPHPATWIRQGRWDDDTQAAAAQGAQPARARTNELYG